MRAIATLCLFACTVFLPALASGASRSPDLGAAVIGTIKVGGAFSLTGDGAALDQEAADGARLAVTEINRTGKLLGKNVEIVLRDSQSRPEMAEQVARQLAEKDRVVAILGYSDTDSALAARYVVQEHRIPFIAVGATSPRLPAEGGEMMFLACFGDNVQAAAGAEFAFGHFGPNACLLWDEGMDYTRLLAGYFK
ncbi:MAG: ABC transporter substrate-binding protein, partial [Syntrophobacteraceae bacterium]|nr:ABC transporter substrate-binding protein [Syntrophobacteraceae bacterium]